MYSSTAFKNVKEGAVSGAKEKRARDKGLFRRQSGRGQLWGDSESPQTLMPAWSHCLSASPCKERLLLFLAAARPFGYQDITDPWPKKTCQ